jgi:hypothetical protein
MKLWVFAVMTTACTVNGKSYGPGSSSTTTPTSNNSNDSAPQAEQRPQTGVPTSSMSMSERSTLHAPDEGSNTGLPAYPSAPQDPWLAVDGDQPKRRAREQWTVRSTDGDCSAAHDHCLEPDAWFIVQKAELARDKYVAASVALFGPEGGTLYPGNTRAQWVRENFIAYHTVPATKANMVPGAIVFGIGRPTVIPSSGTDAVGMSWQYGVLESVDLDVGVYTLKGASDTLMLPGARVAVLTWTPGGKVEIVGGKAKNQLAVTAKDVFLPEK